MIYLLIYLLIRKTYLKFPPFSPLCVCACVHTNSIVADLILYFEQHFKKQYIAQIGLFRWNFSTQKTYSISLGPLENTSASIHPMSFMCKNRSQCRTIQIICQIISILKL